MSYWLAIGPCVTCLREECSGCELANSRPREVQVLEAEQQPIGALNIPLERMEEVFKMMAECFTFDERGYLRLACGQRGADPCRRRCFARPIRAEREGAPSETVTR